MIVAQWITDTIGMRLQAQVGYRTVPPIIRNMRWYLITTSETGWNEMFLTVERLFGASSNTSITPLVASESEAEPFTLNVMNQRGARAVVTLPLNLRNLSLIAGTNRLSPGLNGTNNYVVPVAYAFPGSSTTYTYLVNGERRALAIDIIRDGLLQYATNGSHGAPYNTNADIDQMFRNVINALHAGRTRDVNGNLITNQFPFRTRAHVIRLGWEPTGTWYPWSMMGIRPGVTPPAGAPARSYLYNADAYVLAFRRAANVMKARAAELGMTVYIAWNMQHATWMNHLMPNSGIPRDAWTSPASWASHLTKPTTITATYGNDHMSAIGYPGDDVVDIIDTSLYWNSGSLATWRQNADEFLRIQQALARHLQKPVAYSEHGVDATLFSNFSECDAWMQYLYEYFAGSAGCQAATSGSAWTTANSEVIKDASDRAGRLAFFCYFNVASSEGDWQIVSLDGVPVSERQAIEFAAPPGGGTYTLSVNTRGSTQTTSAIQWNASGAQVVAALEALSNIEAGEVVLRGEKGVVALRGYLSGAGTLRFSYGANQAPAALAFGGTAEISAASLVDHIRSIPSLPAGFTVSAVGGPLPSAPINILVANGSLASLTAVVAGAATTGAATSATATSVTNTAANFAANGLIGATLRITAGTGNGQSRTIVSNTATTITVGSAFSPAPTGGSTYSIDVVSGAVADGFVFEFAGGLAGLDVNAMTATSSVTGA